MVVKKDLSPRELAELIGSSESSVKRWADEGRIGMVRTAGGHRRIPIAVVGRFVRESGLAAGRPELLGVLGIEAGAVGRESAGGDEGEALERALREGDGDRARGLVTAMYLSGMSVAWIADGPIAMAMSRIGELWRHDAAGIAIEHRASDVCAAAVHHLRTLLPRAEAGSPVALGGAPAGDGYVLPSLLAATVLAEEGWFEINLGPNTPLEALEAGAKRYGASLVWVAMSVEKPAAIAASGLRELGGRLAGSGAALLVGGRACPASLRRGGENVHYGASMTELAAFARGRATALRGEGARGAG